MLLSTFSLKKKTKCTNSKFHTSLIIAFVKNFFYFLFIKQILYKSGKLCIQKQGNYASLKFPLPLSNKFKIPIKKIIFKNLSSFTSFNGHYNRSYFCFKY